MEFIKRIWKISQNIQGNRIQDVELKIMLNCAPERSAEYATDTTAGLNAVVCTVDTNIRSWVCCNSKYCRHVTYCNHLLCYQRKGLMLIPWNLSCSFQVEGGYDCWSLKYLLKPWMQVGVGSRGKQ